MRNRYPGHPLAALAAAALVALPVAVPAQREPAAGGMLNAPSVSAWSVYGPGQTHKLRKDAGVQGGGAMRVQVTAKPAAIHEIGATAPIAGAIVKGDRLMLAFWARLPESGDPAPVPAMIQLDRSPFSPIVSGSVALTSEWKLVNIKGVAAGDHPGGSTNINLHLGGAARTIDLGPAFVMKL